MPLERYAMRLRGPTMHDLMLYETAVTATGAGGGRAFAPDGTFHVWLDEPSELGGRGHGNTHEQLYAAAHAAALLAAMRSLRTHGHPAVPAEATVTARVGIGRREGNGFALAVTLEAHLPGLETAAAQALLESANAICAYSRAIAGNVTVTLALA
jgi:lipoyl-dependent peroxiredoxin